MFGSFVIVPSGFGIAVVSHVGEGAFITVQGSISG
jgi:hypothetical protein